MRRGSKAEYLAIVPKLMLLVRLVPSWQQLALSEQSAPAPVCLSGACRVKEECQDVNNI
jgi:hypothetical protein